MTTPKDPRQGRPPPPQAPSSGMARGQPIRPPSAPQREAVPPQAFRPSQPSQPAQLAQHAAPRGHTPRPKPVPRVDSSSLDLSALMDADLDAALQAATEPQMLDESALFVVEAEAAEPLDASALSPLDEGPEPLTDSALRPYAEAPDFGEEPTPAPDAPEAAPDVPLIDGFESTRLGEDAPRPKSARGPMVQDAGGEFSYATCPSCGTPQPQPSPPFCEACGNRLKRPNTKRSEIEGSARNKRCVECGYRNRNEATNCTNCGNRLRA